MGHAMGTGVKVIIGGDCPVFDETYLRSAFDTLKSRDVVLGPVEDGGYFLIGMNRPHPVLFKDICWGSSEVLAQTLSQTQAHDLSVAQLPTLWDLDDESDYIRWQAIRASDASR